MFPSYSPHQFISSALGGKEKGLESLCEKPGSEQLGDGAQSGEDVAKFLEDLLGVILYYIGAIFAAKEDARRAKDDYRDRCQLQ